MASLFERYKEIIQPVGQKLSQVGQSIGAATKQVVANAAEGYRRAPSIQSPQKLTQLANKVQDFNRFTEKYNPIQILGKSAATSYAQVPSLVKSKQYGKAVGKVAEGTGTLAAPYFAATAPAAAATVAGLGGVLNKATGGSFKQGAKDSLRYGAITSPIAAATNPYFAKLIPKSAGLIGSRVAPAAANVLQGIGINTATGQANTSLSIGIDALTGAVGGKSNFGGSKKLDDILAKGKALGFDGISPRVNTVHPEDLDVMREFADTVLRRKGAKKELGELGISAQRLAEHYFGGDWKYVDNKKLASAFEWAIDLNMHIPREARGQLPKLGIVSDAGSFSAPYKRGDLAAIDKKITELIGQTDGVGNYKTDYMVRQKTINAYLNDPTVPRGFKEELQNLVDELDIAKLAKDDPTQYALLYGEEPVKKIPDGTQSINQPQQKVVDIDNKNTGAFVSEVDLPTKLQKPNNNAQSKIAIDDFKEWEKQMFSQENAKLTPRAQSTKNIGAVSRVVGEKIVPSYLSKESLATTKDISSPAIGFTDVYRNFDKVFGKNSKAAKEILVPFDNSKKQMVTDLEDLATQLDSNIVKKYGFKKGSKESAAIQQYGEKNRDFASLVSEFGAKKAKQIVEADGWFRAQYDRLLSDVNNVRKQIYPNDPEKIIPRRGDYYRHFRDLSDTFSGLMNIFENPAGISPKLAGISENTKPKSKWLSFAQARLGKKTDEDAIGGFIDYAKAQTYAKHIDPHISKFRGLRDTIASAMEQSTNKSGLNNFIEFLDDFSNDLSGKTNSADRALQKYIGRKPFRVINWINSRTKANAIVGNVSSMLAQAFNIPQGVAEAGSVSAIKGVGRTVASLFDTNAPIKNSSFIKSRYGDGVFDKFDTGLLNNSKKLAVWMTGIFDEVGTKYIWNSIYDKAIRSNLPNPVEYADDITRKMVAGRGIGEVPLLQKSKVFQLVAPFQLEVANIWHVMREWAGEKAAGKFITFFVVSHLMNRVAKEIRGSDVSIDPIQASLEAYNAFQEEENKATGALRAGGRLVGEALSNAPLGQTAAAMYPEYGFSVGDAKFPTRESLFGKGDPTRFGGGLLATKGLQDPVFSLLPSYGGKQIKKTLEGVKAYNRGFSQTKSGDVRFPIERGVTNQIKTGLFGEYGAKEAADYFDNDRSKLGKSQSEIFKSLPANQGKDFIDSIYQEREINKVLKQLEEGSLDEKEADSLIKQVSASGGYSPLTDTKNKALKEKIDAFTKKKIGLGIDVTEEDLSSAYLSKVFDLPSKSKYEKAIKDGKLYTLASSISNNEDLSDSQKDLLRKKVAKEIGISDSDLTYYEVANDDNNLKTIYVLEALQGQENVIPYLEQGRRKVNDKQLVSDGVIDNLVDEGLITEDEGKALKKIDYDRSGKPKKRKVSTKKPKLVAPKMPTMPVVKIARPKIRKIKKRKANYKITKIRLKGSKKPKKLTLR